MVAGSADRLGDLTSLLAACRAPLPRIPTVAAVARAGSEKTRGGGGGAGPDKDPRLETISYSLPGFLASRMAF